jgi:hypothetical protein
MVIDGLLIALLIISGGIIFAIVKGTNWRNLFYM